MITTILEKSWEISQKVKQNIKYKKSIPRYLPKRDENICSYKILFKDIHAALFIITKMLE